MNDFFFDKKKAMKCFAQLSIQFQKGLFTIYIKYTAVAHFMLAFQIYKHVYPYAFSTFSLI